MDVSIIIVNYNTAGYIVPCIHSIKNETKQFTYEVIVVDNLSTDNSKQLVLDAHPDACWIDMGYNAGFARANNAGIKRAKGTYILLLNGDTILLDGAIDKTVVYLKNDKNYVACGVQLLNEDGSYQISGANVVKGGLNTLLPLPYLGDFVKWVGTALGQSAPSISQSSAIEDVDWIIGAYVMVKAKNLEQAGLLDEDFFMYAEEIEWCSRLKKIGKLCLLGNVQVTHFGGGSSTKAYDTKAWDNSKDLWSKKARQIMLSNFVRIRKEFGLFWFLFVLFFYFLELFVFPLGFIVNYLLTLGKASYSIRHIAGYFKNTIGLLKYFFKIVYNRPYFYKVN